MSTGFGGPSGFPTGPNGEPFDPAMVPGGRRAMAVVSLAKLLTLLIKNTIIIGGCYYVYSHIHEADRKISQLHLEIDSVKRHNAQLQHYLSKSLNLPLSNFPVQVDMLPLTSQAVQLPFFPLPQPQQTQQTHQAQPNQQQGYLQQNQGQQLPLYNYSQPIQPYQDNHQQQQQQHHQQQQQQQQH
jgi:hypothetical protein